MPRRTGWSVFGRSFSAPVGTAGASATGPGQRDRGGLPDWGGSEPIAKKERAHEIVPVVGPEYRGGYDPAYCDHCRSAAGSIVAGVVSVSVNATDNVGVTRIEW